MLLVVCMPLPASYLIPNYFILFRFCVALHPLGGEKKKRKDSAESDDTASMIRGGGYIGVRTTRQPRKQLKRN